MLGFKLDNVIKSLKLLMFVKGSIGQNDFLFCRPFRMNLFKNYLSVFFRIAPMFVCHGANGIESVLFQVIACRLNNDEPFAESYIRHQAPII